MSAPRAALYARVSTTGKGQDLELQLGELRSEATRRGWSAREFTDDGISGAQASRPGLDALLADVRARRFDIVAVWRFDRFARTVGQLVLALDEFTALRVEFVSLREAIDTTTPAGRAMFAMVGAFAQFERDVARERINAGLDRARAKGQRLGRPPADVPLEAAVALLDKGRGFNETARLVRVHPPTLRRHLRAAGLWPRPVAP